MAALLVDTKIIDLACFNPGVFKLGSADTHLFFTTINIGFLLSPQTEDVFGQSSCLSHPPPMPIIYLHQYATSLCIGLSLYTPVVVRCPTSRGGSPTSLFRFFSRRQVRRSPQPKRRSQKARAYPAQIACDYSISHGKMCRIAGCLLENCYVFSQPHGKV